MQTPIQLIKEAREKKGLTREELAKAAGVKLRTLEKWEQGTREPADEEIQKLAAVFGKQVTYKLERLKK